MRLADMSNRLRRERVIFALDVALQDLTAPASTMDVARMIAARLETDELPVIGRIIVSLAAAIPQAQQTTATFRRYGKEMRPWVWSPKPMRGVTLPVDPMNERDAAGNLTQAARRLQIAEDLKGEEIMGEPWSV